MIYGTNGAFAARSTASARARNCRSSGLASGRHAIAKRMAAIATSTLAERAKVQRCMAGCAACAHAQMSGDSGGSAVAIDDGAHGAAISSGPGRYTSPRSVASTRNRVRRHRGDGTLGVATDANPDLLGVRSDGPTERTGALS